MSVYCGVHGYYVPTTGGRCPQCRAEVAAVQKGFYSPAAPEPPHVHASDGSCDCHYPAFWLAKMEAAGLERGAAMWRGHLNAIHAAREAALAGDLRHDLNQTGPERTDVLRNIGLVDLADLIDRVRDTGGEPRP
jgi:hypothetical protein